ncbi:extracellular fatty acid-binding protein-like [Erythrolamprus reginae]|uniref:extracellular fatty acid-binding protein-like n=1 Tax=Erythrolamprus reginae TaxID=121349 RepID=UPI00396C5D04
MKSLLLALGLALCCFVQADDIRFEDFDHSLLPGQGFVVATATNCQKMEKMVTQMPLCPVSFAVLSDGKLEMTMDMRTPKGCKAMKVKIEKKDGVFVANCGRGGTKTVQYVNVSEKFVLFYMKITHPKGECNIASAIVKDVAHTDEATAALKIFGGRHGLGDKEVHRHPAEGTCPRSS